MKILIIIQSILKHRLILFPLLGSMSVFSIIYWEMSYNFSNPVEGFEDLGIPLVNIYLTPYICYVIFHTMHATRILNVYNE